MFNITNIHHITTVNINTTLEPKVKNGNRVSKSEYGIENRLSLGFGWQC